MLQWFQCSVRLAAIVRFVQQPKLHAQLARSAQQGKPNAQSARLVHTIRKLELIHAQIALLESTVMIRV